MRIGRHVIVASVVTAALLAFAACGSDSTSDTPSQPDSEAPPPPVVNPAPPPGDDASADAPGDHDADAPDFPVGKGDPCRGDALPLDQHYVPTGMCARAIANGLGNVRQLTFAPNGDLFAVNGKVLLLRDDDGDGVFSPAEIHEWAQVEGNANNCALDLAGGYMYAGSLAGVFRWPYSASATTAGVAPEDVVVGQPSNGGHGLHTVHVYDNWLYVHSGSSGDNTDPMSPDYDTDRALLRRFDLKKFVSGSPFAWSTGEVITVGLRNMVGYTRNAAGRMYGVVNGMDSATYQGVSVVDDNPGEQIVELGPGRQYGYPFCLTAQRIVPAGGTVIPAGTQVYSAAFGVHDDAWCAANAMKPMSFAQAHSAPLDITFFDVHPKGALPEKYRGGAFISFHGSQNRVPSTGYKVVWLPFDATGNAPMPVSTATTTTFPYETVFGGGNTSGPADGKWTWTTSGGIAQTPRPVGVAVGPIDGALYVSSDLGGYLYRVGQPH
jgi:glucose/arabinose dehydrogenase